MASLGCEQIFEEQVGPAQGQAAVGMVHQALAVLAFFSRLLGGLDFR